jgi:hypothetical protein
MFNELFLMKFIEGKLQNDHEKYFQEMKSLKNNSED